MSMYRKMPKSIVTTAVLSRCQQYYIHRRQILLIPFSSLLFLLFSRTVPGDVTFILYFDLIRL